MSHVAHVLHCGFLPGGRPGVVVHVVDTTPAVMTTLPPR